MISKKRLYVYLQLGGWFTYVGIAAFLHYIGGKSFGPAVFIHLLTAFLLGLGLSHIYRLAAVKLGWTALKLTALIPRIFFSGLFFGLLFQLLYVTLTAYLFQTDSLNAADFLVRTFNWTVLFLLWSVIYFGFNFFSRYRQAEIQNLQWQAAKNEIELNKLKSQLNPHFLFNSLNTIRALIDESPPKAKKSVTGLAEILRKTLYMGEQKTVSFSDELQLVKTYLDLEKMRYEERLSVKYDICRGCEHHKIPALMLQTLVENAVKHGISKLTAGGEISITAQFKGGNLVVKVVNPGRWVEAGSDQKKNKKGFGLPNAVERLKLLYGRDDLLKIENNSGLVTTTLTLSEKTVDL